MKVYAATQKHGFYKLAAYSKHDRVALLESSQIDKKLLSHFVTVDGAANFDCLPDWTIGELEIFVPRRVMPQLPANVRPSDMIASPTLLRLADVVDGQMITGECHSRAQWEQYVGSFWRPPSDQSRLCCIGHHVWAVLDPDDGFIGIWWRGG